MTTGQEPTDPLHGVRLSREELIYSIKALEASILGSTPDENIDLPTAQLAGALGALPLLAAEDAPVEEAEALQIEQFTSSVALNAVGHIVQTRGNVPQRSTLLPYTHTPKQEEKRRVDEAAKTQAKRAKIEERLQTTRLEEGAYQPTSGQIRGFRYTAGGETRKGTWLEQKIKELSANGTEKPIFSDVEARFLTGLSIDVTPEKVSIVRDFMTHLGKLRTELQRLGGAMPPRGLFTAISLLVENAEDPRLLNSDDLRPLREFTSLYTLPDEKLIRMTINTLDEGPFKGCPEIDIAPFVPEPKSKESKTYSTVEIPGQAVTKANILADITAAANRSRGVHVIEESRIIAFIAARSLIIDNYGAENVRTLRTLRPKWCLMPYYVIEVAQTGDEPLVIMDCPVYATGSYFINNGNWLQTIDDVTRKEARKKGAKFIPHDYDSEGNLLDHDSILYAAVKKGHKG
jgi:hypothetical protein